MRGWYLVNATLLWRRWTCIGLVCLATALPTAARAARSADAFAQARASVRRFDGSSSRQRYRHEWIKAIATIKDVGQEYPQSAEAPQALYVEAGLWARLHLISRRGSDLSQALATYERLESKYPRSSLADDALWEVSQLQLKRQNDRLAASRSIDELLRRYPHGDMASRAKALQKQLPRPPSESPPAEHLTADRLVGRRDDNGPAAQVRDLRHWSNPVYTRVVVYLSEPAEARLGELQEDPANNAPARIFVDLTAASLANTVRSELAIDDDLLQRVRVAKRDDGKVRVVLDLKKNARPRLLVMENPYRVVIDAVAADEAAEDAAEEMTRDIESAVKPNPTADEPGPPLTRLVRRRRVVLDAGHGGHDTGAIGPGGVREKDVVLAITRYTQALLDAEGVEALMTRGDDTFISLEERTAIANRAGADAFVSIHANSAPNKKARGIETYYLNVTDDRYSIRLAAVENKTSEEQVSDLQLILADLSTKVNSQESAGLARRVQNKMISYARPLNDGSRDLGVKASLFYVLLGARMPSILVETSFISNVEEAKLLTNDAYQRRLAKAIADAVTEHLKTPVRMVSP